MFSILPVASARSLAEQTLPSGFTIKSNGGSSGDGGGEGNAAPKIDDETNHNGGGSKMVDVDSNLRIVRL
jgi:hypothetical protein